MMLSILCRYGVLFVLLVFCLKLMMCLIVVM